MTGAPYQRIAAEIADRIRKGELRPGDVVPSTRRIMSEWRVAMATATKVIGVLKSEGLVEAISGSGTRVRGDADVTNARGTVPDRGDVLRVAIRMADMDGLDMLSMRRLAAALDIPTMSLYRYAANKGELLLLMADRIFAEVRPPDIMVTDWRPRLSAAARIFRDTFARHPWAAGLFSFTRPQTLPNVMVLAEWNLQTLRAMGLDVQTMMFAHINLFGLVANMSRVAFAEQQARSDTGKDIDAWAADQAVRFDRLLDMADFPTFRYVMAEGFDYDLDLVFEYGLQRMLDGIAAQSPQLRDRPRESAPGESTH